MTDASSETLDSPRTALLEPDNPTLASSGHVGGGSATARAPRRRLGTGRRIPFGRAIGPMLVLGLWSAASASGMLDPRILSAPWKVATTAVDLVSDGRLQTHLLTSLRRAVPGFASGVVVGVLLAVAAGLSRIGEAVVDGTMQVKRALPTLGLIPLLILWLGIGETMKVVVIALVAMIYVYINTFASLTSIDARYVELGEVVGLSR
jgi:sulfonate transport system permease protein